MTPERNMVEREVKSEDPSLSPEANRVLTEEAREAVGSDRVSVPADTPNASEGTSGSFMGNLSANRPLLVITFATLLVVGVIVSLATDSWWALAAALIVHFIGTVIVGASAIKITTETEHASPGATARLEDEGVADADKRLSELVGEFQAGEHDQGKVTPSGDSKAV